jgi:hypothetical protein
MRWILVLVLSMACGAVERVVVDPEIAIHRGLFFPGEIVTQDLSFDAGDQDVEILGIDKSCRCTAVGELPKRVPAGGAAPFRVRFFAGPEVGLHEAKLTVRYARSGEMRARVFRVQAQAEAPLVLDGTPVIRLDAETPTASWNVRRGAHPAIWDDIQVRLQPDDGVFWCAVERADAAVWRVRVGLKDVHPHGVLTAHAVVQPVAHGQNLHYEVEKSIAARIRKDWHAEPEVLYIGGVVAGADKTENVRIVGAEAFWETVRIDSSDPQRCTGIKELTNAGPAIRVTFHAVGDPGSASGRLRLVGAAGDELVIPYVAGIAAAPPH